MRIKGITYVHLWSNYVVTGYQPSIDKTLSCSVCGRTAIRCGIEITDNNGKEIIVGKNCAAASTKQSTLINAMYKEMISLLNKRVRFCDHQSWEKYAVPTDEIVEVNWSKRKQWRNRAKIKYGYDDVQIKENKNGQYRLHVNSVLFHNIFRDMDEAALWYFRIYARKRMCKIVRDYYEDGQKPQ